VTKEDLKGIKLNKLFESLYIIMVDSIASGLSFDFVDQLKSQIAYEIELIGKLGIQRELGLMYD